MAVSIKEKEEKKPFRSDARLSAGCDFPHIAYAAYAMQAPARNNACGRDEATVARAAAAAADDEH